MRCTSELWRGSRVRIAANHAFGEGGCHGRNAGEQISRIQEMFICLKAVAALGFESSFELARTFPVCCGSVGLWAIPIFGHKQLLAREATGDSQLIEILHPQP
jgi:hypothetical protein